MNFEYGLGFKNGLKEAVTEVQEWRKLTIKAHNACPCIDPDEHMSETKNQLNLLGVIESKLRKKMGESSESIFNSMKERATTEILLNI